MTDANGFTVADGEYGGDNISNHFRPKCHRGNLAEGYGAAPGLQGVIDPDGAVRCSKSSNFRSCRSNAARNPATVRLNATSQTSDVKATSFKGLGPSSGVAAGDEPRDHR